MLFRKYQTCFLNPISHVIKYGNGSKWNTKSFMRTKTGEKNFKKQKKKLIT